jgi:hypothetical protein
VEGERARKTRVHGLAWPSIFFSLTHQKTIFPHSHSEDERQARIKAEGWDRFSPVSDTNKPPAGAPPAKKKDEEEEEESDDDEEEDE